MASKKILSADHNSKPESNNEPPVTPPNSTSSSSTTFLPFEKRTRDLPNLSDCHCCGIRINYSNPKDRLQPLESVWRIVLLCRKCSKNVQSGQTCPYCFKETGNSGTVLKCCDCGRRIHRDCVRNYGDYTPWCYLGLGLGFRVCVDCWVPDLLKDSVRIHRRSDTKDVMKSCGNGDMRQKGEKVECEALKRVKKEKALRKSVVMQNAMESSENALDMSDKNGNKGEKTCGSDAVEVVDDVELAIQLHRSMNSSPRILRNKCTENSSCFEISKSRESDNLSSRRSGLGRNNGESWKLYSCINEMEKEKLISTDENDSFLHADKLKCGVLTYERDKKRKLWKVEGEDFVVSEYGCNPQNDSKYNLNFNGSALGCELRFNGQIYKRDKKRKLWRVPDDNAIVPEPMSNQQGEVRYNFSLKCSVGFYRRDKNRKLWQVDDDRIMGAEGKYNLKDLELPLNCSDRTERFRQEPVIYKRRSRFKLRALQETRNELVFGECNSGFCNKVTFEPQYQRQDASKHELILGGTGESCSVKCDAVITLPNGSPEPDRYLFKYGPRRKGSKLDSKFETKLLSDASQNENLALVTTFGGSRTVELVTCDGKLIKTDEILYKDPDCYFFKYGQRVTGSISGSNFDIDLHYDDLLRENQAPAPGLTINSPSKSGTPSDASCDSCPANLLVSTSVSDPSVEET